jgi:hypothetical protein
MPVATRRLLTEFRETTERELSPFASTHEYHESLQKAYNAADAKTIGLVFESTDSAYKEWNFALLRALTGECKLVHYKVVNLRREVETMGALVAAHAAKEVIGDVRPVAETMERPYYDHHSFAYEVRKRIGEGWVLVSIDTDGYDQGHGVATFRKSGGAK